jgi:uncharacterized protein GlcG (DUF336 family)
MVHEMRALTQGIISKPVTTDELLRPARASSWGDHAQMPGGLPITVDGEVIGAVAAGGAKIEQDVRVAQAALAALSNP